MHATEARKAADAQGAAKKTDCTIYRLKPTSKRY